MPNYDFHNCLSPREFEELARDILEIKEGVEFEISGRGKDGGIDLRYWEGETKIIVQVKCYQNDYRQLFNILKNQEKQKAKRLEPTRYILVTSIELDLKKRDEIMVLFDGLIKTLDDIIDRAQLNKLLGQEPYRDVERNHYKLWISSTGVLTSLIEEIVNRDVYAESRWELAEIKKTVKVFVQNPSFGRAIDMLENYKYVIISGEPGIGKTTLGRCLASYFLQYKKYKEFIYVNKVSSALKMYKDKEKQVFFFDDFWGDTFKDDRPSHNEEKQLIRFIQRISNSTNKILILTSREYVIQQGLAEYQDEQLNRTFDIGKCFLQLEDYSDLVKAKILFNHLYFSHLEWDYVKFIANNYERIINHPNYNPRIIETFLSQGAVLLSNTTPVEYYKEFINYLNEPLAFWKSLFIKQTYGAQLTSLILFLSSQPMRLSDLKATYYSCIEAGGKNNESIQEVEFESIIAQLEKTMIKTYRNETRTILVKFQNSSIKDFLYRHLAENVLYYGHTLIQGCIFINQLLFMFKATSSVCYINDNSEEGIFNRKKIFLPEKLKDLLIEKVISDFDVLNYSYVEEDIFEYRSTVYDDFEDCIVRKLHDILFNFGINENARIDEFVINKIQYLCSRLHEEDYPFSYDDMVEFPHLIKEAIPLKIRFDGCQLINDYYIRSRFAEHLLTLMYFEEIFPKEFNDFKKINYKKIKHSMKSLLLEDIDFFASDFENDRIDFLIDFVYPRILERFKLRNSKSFWKNLELIVGYDKEYKINEGMLNKEITNKKRIEDEEEKEMQEMIQAEKDSLLGVVEEMNDEDIIDFIQKNSKNANEALEMISLFEGEKPWYIGPFFRNCGRLSILLDLYNIEKKLPPAGTLFYEQLVFYLINGYYEKSSLSNANSIVDMFSEFAFDMMKKGQIIFSKQIIQEHPAFRERIKDNQIVLLDVLSIPFLVQRGKWYEFQTLDFQAFLSLKRFLYLNEFGSTVSYENFLDLANYFVDIEHNIWLLCTELDLHNFNRDYLIPILREYLEVVDATSPKTACSSTFNFLELSMNFKISQDTFLPEFSGSCCNGLQISALEFIDHDLLEVEFYMSCSEETAKENHSDLLRLGKFIMQQGLLLDDEKNEYELNLAQHCENPELLDILESLGVCEFLWDSYFQVFEKVEKTIATLYKLRMDSYE